MNPIQFRRVSNDTQNESRNALEVVENPAPPQLQSTNATTTKPSSSTSAPSAPKSTLTDFFKSIPRNAAGDSTSGSDRDTTAIETIDASKDVTQEAKNDSSRDSATNTVHSAKESPLNLENTFADSSVESRKTEERVEREFESSQASDAGKETSQTLDNTQQDEDDDDPGFMQKSQRDDDDNDDGRIERPKEPNYKPPPCPFHVTKHLIVDCFGDPPKGPIPSKIPTERVFLKNYRARRMYDDLKNPAEKTFYVQFIDEEGKFNVMYEKGDEKQVFTADNATGAWGPIVEARSQHYKCNSKVSGPKQLGITQDRVRRIICNIVMDREITDEEWRSVNSQSVRPQKEPVEKVVSKDIPSNEKVVSQSRKRKRKPSEQLQLTLKLQKRKQEAPIVEKKTYPLQGYVRADEQEFQRNFRHYLENLLKEDLGNEDMLSNLNGTSSFSESVKENSELTPNQHNSQKSHQLSQCFICKLGVRQQHHHTLRCNLCHRDYHMACIAYDHIVINNNNNGWICPSHRCCSCGVSSVNIKCSMCPNAFCVQCQPFRMISEEACSGFCLCSLCSDTMKKVLADPLPVGVGSSQATK